MEPSTYSPISTDQFRQPNNTISLERIEQVHPSNVQSAYSGGTADILPKERAKATFEVEKMTNILDGSTRATERRRFIISTTEGKNVFDRHFWERETLLKEHVHLFLDAHEEYMGKIVPTYEDGSFMTDNGMLSGSFVGHYGLFLPTVVGQGSPEQQSEWLPKIITFQVKKNFFL